MNVPLKISPIGVITGVGPAPLVGLPATLGFIPGAAVVGPGQVIPLEPVYAQQFSITLGNQPCVIKLYFKDMWIPTEESIPTNPPNFEPITVGFLNLFLNDELVIGGVRCNDRNVIVREKYRGFIGDLSFIDTHGASDPLPTGLGTRWLLTYWPLL